jgi:translation elongation factor EF-Tu-like GTPase
MSEVTYDIRAFITLLPTAKGGRSRGIMSGYKPSFTFNTIKHYSGELKLINKKELRPGQSAEVMIYLLPATTLKKNLKLNESFTIVEGNKAIGNGIIIHDIAKKETELHERN